MVTRMRLVRAATALLYFGPLLAGLCGFGWGMVAAFTGIFVVWLMVVRPEQWPITAEEWMLGEAGLAALAQVLSQLLLVGILFGVGRGIGGVADIGTMSIDPLLPLAMSFASIPLCRMLWNPEEAASQGYFLDEEAKVAFLGNSSGQATLAVIPLLNLPDTAPDAQVSQAVAETLDLPTADLRLNALKTSLAAAGRSHTALRRALVIWVSEPEVVAPGHIPGSMATGFALANGNLDLIHLYLPRAMALISAFPGRAGDFPEPESLRQKAANLPPSDLPQYLQSDLSDGLRALAQAVQVARGEIADNADFAIKPLPGRSARHA